MPLSLIAGGWSEPGRQSGVWSCFAWFGPGLVLAVFLSLACPRTYALLDAGTGRPADPAALPRHAGRVGPRGDLDTGGLDR